jgi:hypothetical protein
MDSKLMTPMKDMKEHWTVKLVPLPPSAPSPQKLDVQAKMMLKENLRADVAENGLAALYKVHRRLPEADFEQSTVVALADLRAWPGLVMVEWEKVGPTPPQE